MQLSRIVTTVGPVLFAASLVAQNPLTTTFADNNAGAVGGAVYFDLATGAFATAFQQIDLNFASPPGATGSIDVYVTPGSWIGAGSWTPAAAGAATAAGAGLPSAVTLSVPVTIPATTSIGVCIVANGLAHAFTNGAAPTTSFGQCPLTLTAGGASNTPFAAPVFSPRIVNTSIHLTSVGDCATVNARGSGCGDRFASIYEQLSPLTMDLQFSRVLATPVAGGFDVTTLPAPVQPVGSLSPPQTVIFGGGGQVAIGTLGIHVGENGWVAYGPGNSTGFAPSVAAMLNNPSTAIYAWTDLDPGSASSGLVTYEEDPAALRWRVTFDNVVGWGTPDPNTVQFEGDRSTGAFSITFGNLSPSNPEDWLVGYSVGGPSNDPGPSDLSTGGPFAIAAADLAALRLSATSGRPIQQVTMATPVVVTTENIPAVAVLHVGLLGFTQLQAPLAGLGLPSSCFLHTSLDVVLFTPVPAMLPPTHTWTAAVIPPAPSLIGFQFSAQAAALGPGLLDPNARTSNALDFRVGV